MKKPQIRQFREVSFSDFEWLSSFIQDFRQFRMRIMIEIGYLNSRYEMWDLHFLHTVAEKWFSKKNMNENGNNQQELAEKHSNKCIKC